MEKLLLIGAFLLLRYLVTSIFKKNKNKPANKPKKAKPNQNLDDILGDFMKQLEKKSEPKVQPVTVNSDNHKAEEDSHKKLDWQEVTTSKFASKKPMTKQSKFQKINIPKETMEPIEVLEVDEENTLDFEEIDLRKAVIYKEILDRKYFTI